MLPNTYWQLEYIESTGTQWISTGLAPQISFEVEMEVARTGNNSSDNVILGMTNHSSSGYRVEIFNPSGKYKLYTSPTGTSTEATTNTPDDIFVNLKYFQNTNTQTLTINDDEVITKTGTTSATGYCDIFYYRSNASYYGKYKLRKFICKNDGELVRNFIPAMRKSDYVVGLYDDVNDVFYTNAGTGTFIAGKIIDAPLNITFTDNPLAFKVGEDVSFIANFKRTANCRFKVNGEWKMAMMYKKINGEWVTGPTRVKVNGTWKDGS